MTHYNADILLYFLCSLTLLAIMLVYFIGWAQARRATNALQNTSPLDEAPSPENAKSVSIIVLAESAEDLDEYLQTALAQQYPCFEVIVVACHTLKDNQRLSGKYSYLAEKYNIDLKICFYPPLSRSLSQRKLAITIGLKAAKYDFALITNANCLINSEFWLAEMMKQINGSNYIDISLGLSVPDFDTIPKSARPMVRINTFLSDAQWIAAAANGNSYRGDGTNLIYRRQIFFDHKGFGPIQQLENGEDDLFINKIAQAGNTALALGPQARLTFNCGLHSLKQISLRREQHWFTHKFLPQKPFLTAGFAACCRFVALFAATAIIITNIYNIYAIISAVIAFLALWTIDFLSWRKLANALGDNRSSWLVPILLLLRPIINIPFKLRCKRHLNKNYTLSNF